MAKGQTYDEDLKKAIASLYLSEKQASYIIRLYGISRSVLYKWVKLYLSIKWKIKQLQLIRSVKS